MNRAVGILGLLFLCGCSDNVEKDLAACKLQAIQIYEPGVSELKWEEPILSYIGICMTAAGYVRSRHSAVFPAGRYAVYLLLASEELVVSLRGVGFGRRPYCCSVFARRQSCLGDGDLQGHDRRFAPRRGYWCGSRLASKSIGAGDRVRSAWQLLVGIFGALIASALFPSLGLHGGGGIFAAIIAATLGAVILLLIVRLIRQASA